VDMRYKVASWRETVMVSNSLHQRGWRDTLRGSGYG
jgi:hypothetical protein